MNREQAAEFLAEIAPDHAGSAWLKLESVRARGADPGPGLVRKCARWAEMCERSRDVQFSALELEAFPDGRRETVEFEPVADTARDEREAERLEMLRAITVALARAPRKVRARWDSMLAAAREAGHRGGGSVVPEGLDKHVVRRVRHELRRRLGLDP